MAIDTIWKNPFVGAGLNNSSVVSPARSVDSTSRGVRELNVTVTHNYYLVLLVEVGIVGFLLMMSFFGRIVLIALSHIRAAENEMKALLVGIIGSLASIAVHNFGDPFGTHMVWAMLWLYSGLMLAMSRQIDLTDASRPRPAPIRRVRMRSEVPAGSAGPESLPAQG